MPRQKKTLTEATHVTEATPVPDQPGRHLISLVSPGWGSSGFYGADVLEAAAGPDVFPAGTHMYLDHPGVTERMDRPERSVRDLAAVLTEDARWDGNQLVAEATVFSHAATALSEMQDAIGVSIRASAEVEQGEAEGRRGTIVTRLVEGISVDFVTHAGRGGHIVSVLESARPHTVVERAVHHGVTEATANELREWLQDVLRETYGGDKSWVWVRDFDDSNVWYEHETPDEMGTYQHTYEVSDDNVVTLSGSPTEVRAETKYVPVARPGSSTDTTESQEDTMPQIEEARLRQLEADAGRVTAAESARDEAVQRAETAERQLAESTRTKAVDDVIAEAINGKGVTFDALQLAGLRATAPVKESGDVDLDTFKTTVEAEVKKLVEAKAADEQVVTRLGGRPATATEAQQENELREANDQQRAAMFGRQVKGA